MTRINNSDYNEYPSPTLNKRGTQFTCVCNEYLSFVPCFPTRFSKVYPNNEHVFVSQLNWIDNDHGALI